MISKYRIKGVKILKKIFSFILIMTVVLVGCSNKKEDNNQNNNESNTFENTKTFLENSYTKNDIKQIPNFDEMVSKRFKKTVENQHQSYDTETSTKKEADNIKLYKNTSGNSLEVMYSIEVKVTDDEAKNINYTERFGKINYKKESGNLKIDKLEEIDSRQINEE